MAKETQKDEQMTTTANDKQPIIVKTTWAKAFSRIGVTAILVFGAIYGMKVAIKTPAEAIQEIAKGFISGEVKTEFVDYVTRVRGVNQLQIAQLNSVDTFHKTDSKSVLWESIGLPDVKVEIEAPVEYTFYLDLKKQWDFAWQDDEQGIIVIAPQIEYNTPAIDVSQMKVRITEGSVWRDEEDVRAKLTQELTTLSKRMASEKISLIREIARNETRQFIINWFIKVRFKDSDIKPHIQMVYFVDEAIPGTIQNIRPQGEQL